MATQLKTSALIEVGSRLGVPLLVLLIVLGQLVPKIDRGIQIADHVDAELQYLALRGCAPTTQPVVTDRAFDTISSGFTSNP